MSRSSIIFFTSTIHSCMILSGILDKLGIVAVSLHSMKKQKERKVHLHDLNLVK